MVVSQVPGAEEAIKAAANRGWEAVALVGIVISILSFTVWFMRQYMQQATDREQRLSDRVTNLENFIRDNLLSEMKRNSETMVQVVSAAKDIELAANAVTQQLKNFSSILSVRPCMAEQAVQSKASDLENAIERNTDALDELSEQRKP